MKRLLHSIMKFLCIPTKEERMAKEAAFQRRLKDEYERIEAMPEGPMKELHKKTFSMFVNGVDPYG